MIIKSLFSKTALAVSFCCSFLVPSLPSQSAPVSNPDWETVTSKLDEGGSFYLYTDIETVIEDTFSYVDTIIKELPPTEQVQVRMGATMARTVLDALGLNELDDLGMSIRPNEDGSGRAITFLALEEEKGIFSLRGHEPGHLESMNFIPNDAVMAFAQNLEYDQILPLIEQIGTATMGPMASTYIQETLNQLNLESGFDVQSALESLDGEIAGWMTLGEVVQLEGGNQVLEVPTPSFAFLIKTKDKTLFNTLEGVVLRSGEKHRLIEGTPLGDMITFEVKENPLKLDPVIAQHDNWLFIASSPKAFADSLNARKAGTLQRSSEEFKKLSEGLPTTYNSMTFISPRLYKETAKLFESLLNFSKRSSDGTEVLTKQTYTMLLSNLENEHGLLTIRINDPDGLLWISQGQVDQSSFIEGPLLLCVPMFAAAIIQPRIEPRDRVNVITTQSQMRSYATAIEAYNIDCSKYPISTMSPDLVISLSPDSPPTFPSFNVYKGRSSAMSLTSPIAYISTVSEDRFNEGQPFGYLTKDDHWLLFSPGPDRKIDLPWEEYIGLNIAETSYEDWALPYTYDPTNGIVSDGDIWRVKQ
jgi:hypothetical protein